MKDTQFTSEYPTRYRAFEENGIIWINNEPKNRGGFEYAAYQDKQTNTEHPHIEDGIYMEVISYQGIKYQMEGHATKPNRQRQQFNRVLQFTTLPEALVAGQEFIKEAEEFINGTSSI